MSMPWLLLLGVLTGLTLIVMLSHSWAVAATAALAALYALPDLERLTGRGDQEVDA